MIKKFLMVILALTLSCVAFFGVACSKEEDKNPTDGGTENSQDNSQDGDDENDSSNGDDDSNNNPESPDEGGDGNGDDDGIIPPFDSENELPPVPIPQQ